MSTREAESVLEFWFPPDLRDTHQDMARQLEWWFRAGADAGIAERFASLTQRAERGELDRWTRDARTRLALIVVLDQFPRSLYRGTARVYAQDPRAQQLTLDGLENGHYAALTSPWERTFFLMPLGHSEQLAHLDRAVALAAELAREAPESIRAILEHSASQARGHREVVTRFGRQPHRNAILGRQSTPEELDYLAKGQFVHQRSIPSEPGRRS